jgi:hypothetical protein
VLLAHKQFFALSCSRTVFKYGLAKATHRENSFCAQAQKSYQMIAPLCGAYVVMYNNRKHITVGIYA